jgi:uncharacterized protein DUF4446
MQELASPLGLIAIGAAGGALVALLLSAVLFARVRGLRRAQTAVLGNGRRDLVDHAERLQVAFTELRDWVEESMHRLDGRSARLESRLDGCIAYHSVIRYDAYGEMSGRQSSTLALLDAHRTGVVISSILHRDQARIYMKPVQLGEAEIELSPEESQAVEAALAATPA